MSVRPTKLTFAEVRDMGVRGILVYCAYYRCSRSIAISGDNWPDGVRLSDIEHRFVCEACASAVPTCGRISIGTRSASAS